MKATHIYTEKFNTNRKLANRALKAMSDLQGFSSCKFNTGNTYGTKSEVLQALVKHGELPKSVLKLSESEWCSAGYYCDKVHNKGIEIIEL